MSPRWPVRAHADSGLAQYLGPIKRRHTLLIAVIMVTAAGSAAAAAGTRLVISGAFHATSARTVARDESCRYRPNHTLIYQSDALRLGRSAKAVVRVQFVIRRYRGLARYAATASALYRRTAVQAVTGRNAATGVASAFYIATSGSVRVSHAQRVGRVGDSASLSGTVHARLRKQGGSARLRLDGTWHCRIPSEANGE
jgi:hypothetical protein